jgi:hypothetical protein
MDGILVPNARRRGQEVAEATVDAGTFPEAVDLLLS